jgi:hypothetical protein
MLAAKSGTVPDPTVFRSARDFAAWIGGDGGSQLNQAGGGNQANQGGGATKPTRAAVATSSTKAARATRLIRAAAVLVRSSTKPQEAIIEG